MRYLADTNVAARRILTADPAHSVIKHAVDTLLLRGEEVSITAQNVVEFQALATRPLDAEQGEPDLSRLTYPSAGARPVSKHRDERVRSGERFILHNDGRAAS